MYWHTHRQTGVSGIRRGVSCTKNDIHWARKCVIGAQMSGPGTKRNGEGRWERTRQEEAWEWCTEECTCDRVMYLGEKPKGVFGSGHTEVCRDPEGWSLGM